MPIKALTPKKKTTKRPTTVRASRRAGTLKSDLSRTARKKNTYTRGERRVKDRQHKLKPRKANYDKRVVKQVKKGSLGI